MKLLMSLFLLVFISGCASMQSSSTDSTADVFQNGGLKFRDKERRPSAMNNIAVPSDEVFDSIGSHAQKKSYIGHDVVACFTENGDLKLGGTSHWGGTMQLFLEYAGGRMEIGVLRRKSAPGAQPKLYSSGNLTLEIVNKGYSNNIRSYEVSVMNKAGQRSEILGCFERNSGLE